MTKQGQKYTATAKTERKDPGSIVREVGERQETFSVQMTPEEIDQQRRIALSSLSLEEACIDAFKELRDNHKAELGRIRRVRADARRLIAEGAKQVEVTVRELLTVGNEVIRVRQDTGEQIHARNARADELQENLFPDVPPMKPLVKPEPAAVLAQQDDAFPDPEEAFGGQPH